MSENVVYKATKEVKYKDLCEVRINSLLNSKRLFENEYDDMAIYKDLRWRTHLETLFFDQLAALTIMVSKDEIPEQAIGEYVMEFFVCLEDDELFAI